ncbi:glucosaminidase domain-containing protein [Vibrio fluminensis]|uniref:glucosaminidase domain-containing protein n=1 Tax=Vibrio fluminensis TaxID=2783614 RepID=UPI001889A255|nr:glucosaminidase domain-containing protein [Vibrio fluminensis]
MSSLSLSRFTTFSLLTLLSVSAHAATSLPLSPEQIAHPYPTEQVTELSSAKQLITNFEHNHYQLDQVATSNKLPSYFIENLPKDLNTLSVEQKTSGFIRLLLPTIKAVNDQILEVRSEIKQLAQKPRTHRTAQEQAWLKQLMISYDVKSNDIHDLLLHVDIIPVGMVLAQGIDESGWGTSHFAVQGNSLYGEHLPAHGGKYLTTPGGHVKVAAFDNLYAGTASYMHNLNTTRAYQELWHMRQNLRMQNNLNGYELVAALAHYSTRGEAYVDNLRSLIKRHHLDSFDHVTLETANSEIIRFRH